jgi:hypothetical protein
MAPTPAPEINAPAPLSQADFQEALHEKLRSAIRLTLTIILEEEVTAFIGAPRYGRAATRRDQRNGYYARDLLTTAGKCEDLSVPRTRGGFRTQVFERYQRRQAALDTAISEMFVFGTSTTRVGEVVETLTGEHPSPSTVSRVFHTLEAEFEAWKTRPLAARYVYAFADGTYFTVIYDNEGQKMPILAVIGINEKGEREVLAFTVGERENQGAWEDLLEQLKARGVQKVDLWITDGNQATAAMPRQRGPAQVLAIGPPTLRQAQNGQCAQLRARQAARPGRTGAQGDLLSGQPHPGRPGGGGLLRKVCSELSDCGRVPQARPGGLPNLLRLPAGALEDDPHDERDRTPL